MNHISTAGMLQIDPLFAYWYPVFGFCGITAAVLRRIFGQAGASQSNKRIAKVKFPGGFLAFI
jgi:hypothetical protein